MIDQPTAPICPTCAGVGVLQSHVTHPLPRKDEPVNPHIHKRVSIRRECPTCGENGDV